MKMNALTWSKWPVTIAVLVFAFFTSSTSWAATAATITVQPISSVIVGNSMTVTCRVTNTGTDTRTFGVGAEILDGATVKADLGQRTTSTISPGNSANVTFTYTIPTSWTAKNYTLHAVVWSGTPGSSTWLDDDSRSFTVVAQTIAATITIRAISSVIQGNQLSVTCDIRNDGNVSRTFGVGAEIKDGSTVKADLGTKTTSTISPGSSSSVTFTYTIPTGWTAKDYTLHAVAWSGTPGSSTWLDDDNRNFTVVAQTIAATISIRAISSVIQGNQLSVTCDVQNDGNVSRTFGIGAEIKDGSTVKADLGTKTTSTISPGSSSSVTFTYTIPAGWTAKDYTLHAVAWSGTPGSSTWLDDDNRNFTVVAQSISATVSIDPISSVQAGGTVSIRFTITNTGNVNNNFGVGCEIWKDTTKQADVGSKTTGTLAPGNAASDTFTYSIPANWVGSHFARVAVWSGTPGSSTWLNSADRAFTVTLAPLALHGRIAYHSYSDYMAAPVDSTDGNAFVYKLDGDTLGNITDSLAIDNSMNPHFSPDGAAITFMAIPVGAARNWNSLEVYVYDLAEGQLSRLTTDSVPDEDPKFSPDGSAIVWKRSGQIWTMQRDGTAKIQLTTTGDEKSGPNYSPDGAKIVYWSSSSLNADIWRMNANGSSPGALVANASVQDYYPIYRDNNNILYSRWESTSDHHDKVYNVEISSGISTRLAVNVTGVEDADAAPVDATYLVFSSTRSGGKGSYDILIGRYDNGGTHTLGNANSTHKDLGACYSPYTYARKIKMQAPANGSSLTVGASYTIQVRAYSDGGVWSGASPSATFQGPSSQTYTDLRDDGTGGDVVAGDGTFSKTISLPASAGAYTVTASAQSVEPGVTRQIVSSSISVTLNPANAAPTDISLSSSSIAENQPSGTAVGTLSTTDPDSGNTFTYSLVSGSGSTDNGSFTISGSTLQTAASFDYETKSSYSIRVRSTDQGSLFVEKAFTVTVTDVAEGSLVVTPASQSFGQVAVGSVSTKSFILQNTSGGTIAGNASVSSPFSIFSGGAYSIPAGQSNVVIVQYSPGGAGTHSNNVTFTGGAGSVRPVTGQAFSNTSDADSDGMTDWEEIIAGTSPSNAASFYQSYISTVSVQSNITIYSGSPTFTNRLYDASWSSNLVGGWIMLGLDVPGRADNQPVPLVVTNGGGVRFFRTSVKLPPSP